jgi:proline iminopeptidase
MKTLYDPIEPYQQGMLKVSEIHDIYYEQCGNPDGQPVVFLHGGPGGGIIAGLSPLSSARNCVQGDP